MAISARSLLPGGDEVERLAAEIAVAKTPAVLSRHAEAARQLCRRLLDAGWGTQLLTRTLSQLNDRVAERIVAWAAARGRLPAANWCWLGFGSEGRLEQTLATDQDNGLLFLAGDAAEAAVLRTHFLPFADMANQALADCGFPLCEGGIMAKNPECCLSLDEWRQRFHSWVRTPSPEALLNATIFFDFRALSGEVSLAQQLAADVQAIAKGNEIFLRMMTENALQAEPPLGRIKDFVTDDDGGIDIKKHGTRLFVDAARILALAAGVPKVGTLERLTAVAAAGELGSADAQAASHAFVALQSLRLAAQCGAGPAGNRLAPDVLNEFDRHQLRGALRQARALQTHLKARFHLDA